MAQQGSARPPGAPAAPSPESAASTRNSTRAAGVPLALPPAAANHDLIVVGA